MILIFAYPLKLDSVKYYAIYLGKNSDFDVSFLIGNCEK